MNNIYSDKIKFGYEVLDNNKVGISKKKILIKTNLSKFFTITNIGEIMG